MRNKITAIYILLTMAAMPGFCATNSNFSVTPPPEADYTSYTSQTQYTQVPYQQTTTTSSSAPLQGYVSIVPTGVNIPVTTTMTLSSETCTLGQSVTTVLTNNFYYNNKLVATAGSSITGNVTLVRKGGHAGKNGQLQIRFTQINTPQGNIIPISGMIKTDDGTGILHAATAKDTSKDYAKDIAIGSGAGAVLGLTMGALSGGSVGQGAIYGTAIGGGAGLVKSLWDKGIDVTIPANSGIEITLDQPITVKSTK